MAVMNPHEATQPSSGSSSGGGSSGGGVDTGADEGDEHHSGGSAGSNSGRGDSGNEVSPGNSPGHPANAPTQIASTTGGSSSDDDDGAQQSTNQPASNRVADRVAKALNRDGVSLTEEDGVIVSRDSNGYVTVRDGNTAVVYRSDGSVSSVLASDDDGGYRAPDGQGRAMRRAQEAYDKGHVADWQTMQLAASRLVPDGDPSSREVNAINAGLVLRADNAWFQQQYDTLPDDLVSRADRLNEVAAVARDTSARWANANLAGWGFADEAGNHVVPGDYFMGLAHRIDASAAENRRIHGHNTTSARAAQDFLAADRVALSPLTNRGQSSDLDEIAENHPARDFLEVEGNLAAVVANYERLVAEWERRPENQQVRVQLGRAGGGVDTGVHDGDERYGGAASTLTPADYFRDQLDRYKTQLAGTQERRTGFEAELVAVDAAADRFRSDDADAQAALTYERQPTDPEEVDHRGPFREYIEAEGNLGYTADRYSRLEQHWLESPANETLQIPDGQGGTITPAEYFARRNAAITGQSAELARERSELEPQLAQADARRRAYSWSADDLILEDRPNQRYFLPMGTAMDALDGRSTMHELTPLEYLDWDKREAEREANNIRGDLSQTPNDMDVRRLMENMAYDRANTPKDELTPRLDAQFDRLQAFISGDYATVDAVRAEHPGWTDAQVKERVLQETMLDLAADDVSGTPGGQQIEGELRRRGFGLNEADEYKQVAIDRGWTNNLDLAIVGGGTVGGRIAFSAVRHVVPFAARIARPITRTRFGSRASQRVPDRFKKGILASGVEEVGEETGEAWGEALYTGDPVAVFLNPMTYAQAGASIAGSAIVEADAPPGPRIRNDRLADGSRGPVHRDNGLWAQPFGAYDPAAVVRGNRMLDQRAATRRELENYLFNAPPPGSDMRTHGLRGTALARHLNDLDARIGDFRQAHPGMVIGHTAGGAAVSESPSGLNVVSLPTISTSELGIVQPMVLSPGDSRFMMRPQDHLGAYLGTYQIHATPSDPLGASVRPGAGSFPSRGVDGYSADSDQRGLVDDPVHGRVRAGTVPGSRTPVDGVPAAGEVDGSSTAVAIPGVPIGDRGAVGVISPGVRSNPLRDRTYPGVVHSAPAPGRISITQPGEVSTPTQSQPQGEVPTGRQAPPGTIVPGAPVGPGSPWGTVPPGMPSPSLVPSHRPQITPSPGVDPGPARTPDTIPLPIRVTTPGSHPGYGVTTEVAPYPQPEPATTPEPEATPTASPEPETNPTPEPQTNPTPGVSPSSNITATPTPVVPTSTNTNETKRRNRPDPGDTDKIIEQEYDAEGNPLYPREVEFVTHSLKRVNLATGEVYSRPLSNTNVRSFKVTRRSPEQLGSREVHTQNLDIDHRGGTVSAKQVPHRTQQAPAVYRREDAPPTDNPADEFGYLDQPRPVMGNRARRRRRGRRYDDDLPVGDVGGDITITVDEPL